MIAQVNNWLDKSQQMQAALQELKDAEDFFNSADSHQLDYAIARLNAARAKVDMLYREAKELN